MQLETEIWGYGDDIMIYVYINPYVSRRKGKEEKKNGRKGIYYIRVGDRIDMCFIVPPPPPHNPIRLQSMVTLNLFNFIAFPFSPGDSRIFRSAYSFLSIHKIV